MRQLVFQYHPTSLSLPIPDYTCVSEHELRQKRAFWACFPENDGFQAQNRLYKSQHWKLTRQTVFSKYEPSNITVHFSLQFFHRIFVDTVTQKLDNILS